MCQKSRGRAPSVYTFRIVDLTFFVLGCQHHETVGPNVVNNQQVDRTPDTALATCDPGDEVGRRYRVQYTWAAIVCCMMFDDTQDVVEVLCEQHEDVLLKHRDGRYTGHQVKTRESDQPLWKASDAQIKSAFARFIRLDSQFSGLFRSFRFMTGHPFHVANNSQSLPFVLSQITAASTLADLPSSVATWLRRTAGQADSTDTFAFQALKKATAADDLPKLRDSTIRLVDTLTGCWSGAADCSHALLLKAAQTLIDECARASALDHQQTLPAYLSAISSPDAEIAARIAGKRMTVERVGAILTDSLHSTSPLSGPPENRVEPGNGSTDLMLRKLDAGGFSAVSCNSAEDLRDKAEYLGIAWTKQHGRDKGLDRYNHVRSVVLNDASRAFEAARMDSERFGPAMREELRRLLQERRARGEQLFDCTDEHLEGTAYSLTAQCEVAWSTDRPWEAVQ